MKKLLLLFVGIFALLSCEVKNSYQEPEAGKDFSLVDEISVSVNLRKILAACSMSVILMWMVIW